MEWRASIIKKIERVAVAEGVPILIIGLFMAIVFANLGFFVTGDTWLALVSGREVATYGLPHTDTLTLLSNGERWVNQQWLGQVILYGIHSLGGLELLALTHAVLVIVPFVAAVAIVRRRGADARSTAMIGLLAIEPCLVVGANIRTQSFAFGLFVIVLWLLSSKRRLSSNGVFWTIPVLAVWGNLHGSVVLGASLVALAGVLSACQAFRGVDVTEGLPAPRSVLLSGLAVAAVFVSPYAPSLPNYYEVTLFNPQFRTLISEWRAPAPSLILLPLFVLGGTSLVVLGRAGSRLPVFDRIVIVGTLLMALAAYRNLAWFGLAALMLLPPVMGATSVDEIRPPRIAGVVSCFICVGVAGIAIASLVGLDERVRERFPPLVIDKVSVEASREKTLQIFADTQYADWLLWYRPQLAGRLLFDARFELLSPAELRDVAGFTGQIGANWRGGARGARLFVLELEKRPLGGLATTWSVLLKSAGARKLYAESGIAVVLMGPGG